MYAAWLGQSAGATICSGRGRSRSWRRASSSAVAGRKAPSRWQCSSALRHDSYGDAAEILGQRIDMGQLAIQSGVVEAVADHELVGDDESAKVDLDLDLPARGPVEQGGDAQRGGAHAADAPGDRADRYSGVDDVLDQQ